jgi:hypothetical protein
MKNETTKKLMKASSILLLAAFYGMFFVACGKNEQAAVSAPASPVGGFGTGSCPSCVAGSTLLATAVGRNTSYSTGQVRMELGLEFFGQAQAVAPQYPGQYPGQNSFQAYSGPVGAQGKLKVLSNDFPATCNIPVGEYQLSVVQGQSAGQWQGERFGNLQLVSTSGPAQLKITIPSGFILSAVPARVTSWGGTYPYSLDSGYYGFFIESNAVVQGGFGGGGCSSIGFGFI